MIKNEKIEEGLVSIIVSVYNVAGYIDRCMRSLVNQTYKNIEIILINDGSTDEKSADICYEWSKRDSRIIFINKKNEHLGPTRNRGMDIAKGEYITFVDPDDCVEESYVEKLYVKALEENADITCCDFYEIYEGKYVDGRVSKKKDETGILHSISKKNCKRLFNMCVMCGCFKLYRADFLRENDLREIDNLPEDLEFVPRAFYLANKIAFVNEALYFYYVDREGNDTTSNRQVEGLLYTLEKLNDQFIEKQWIKDCYDGLKEFNLHTGLGMLSRARKNMTDAVYREWKEKYELFFSKYFGNWKEWPTFELIGSYSLRLMFSYYCSYYSDNLTRYMYSSLISMMSEPENELALQVDIPNKFRQSMLEADMSKKAIKQMNSNQKAEYVVIDFLEERFDILQKDSFSMTASYEWQESFNERIKDYKVLKNGSKDYIALWKQKCLQFIQVLCENYEDNNIILVKNYYTVSYGKGKKEKLFDDFKHIQEKNKMLAEMYDFFEKNCKNCNVIEMKNDELLYADSDGMYGCEPIYYNAKYYRELATQLEGIV